MKKIKKWFKEHKKVVEKNINMEISKEQVLREMKGKYIWYNSLEKALKNGMPNIPEYTVTWLRKKISQLEPRVGSLPKTSLKTWHGPYGWRYESTTEDILTFEKYERELIACQDELRKLKIQRTENEKNAWYWNESF